MSTFPDFPVLDSPSKCAALWSKYPEKVVGMWATGSPRQNVDVLWRLRQELLKLDVPVVFFFRESAKLMLDTVMAPNSFATDDGHIYQLDDAKFFCLLNFVDVLVTNDYLLHFPQSRYINAKLVCMPHHATHPNTSFRNCFYDYAISDPNRLNSFDYSYFPDSYKVHRNPYSTQLVAGHAKLDIVAEERQNAVKILSTPILLIHASHVSYICSIQKISFNTFLEIWIDIVNTFLDWCPNGIVVFRPTEKNIIVQQLNAKFADDGRFIFDVEKDNKFWLSRARYFVTDISKSFINFCMTAHRPSIRMMYTPEAEAPRRDEWGWTISRPNQLIPLLEEMDREEKNWTESLLSKQQREMPTLGQNFPLLAGMVKRIYNNDDDPDWRRIDKGHTPCQTSRDLLKLVAKCTKKSPYELSDIDIWLKNVLISIPGQIENPKIWLLLLRRALLSTHGNLSSAFKTGISLQFDPLASRISNIDTWWDNALSTLPLSQTIGLLRHLLRKYPQKIIPSLFLTISSNAISGPHKKRALFFLLMEVPYYEKEALLKVNELAEAMPEYFSRPVLDKLNRFLPLAMKVPLSLRRFAACILGIKKPLAKNYWQAHRKLA